ncbi:down syndrome cell adhesion molecule-like protein Dscam2, partial [Caerostris extrusa]
MPMKHEPANEHFPLSSINRFRPASKTSLNPHAYSQKRHFLISEKFGANIHICVPPVIDKHYFRDSSTVDEGSRTKLVCIVSRGDPPLRFRWLKNGLPFPAHGDVAVQTTEDSSIVTFKGVTSTDRGLYSCLATNLASSANMTTHLVVNVSPQFTVEPTNSTVAEGDTVRLDCAAVGFPAPSILWKKLIYSENTAGDFAYVHSGPRAHRYTNGTLVISEAEEQDAGAYMCQANNGIGASLSKIVSLQVLAPPRFKESFQSQSTREGSNATLKCDATGHAPITITWQKNKTLLYSRSNEKYIIRNITKEHEMSSELHILAAERADTGTYTCTAVNDIGRDESVIQFLVQGVPDAPSNLTVVNTTSRSISLFWEVIHNGNSRITGSIVQYQTLSDTHWNGQTSQLIVSGTDDSATLRALTPITLYFVRIIAENALGQSRPSAVINVTTEEEAPSGFPREVQVHSTGAQSIKVTWKPPSLESQHGRIMGYYVGYRMSQSPDSYVFQQVESNPRTEHQATYIRGLRPSTHYDVVLKAFNSVGDGPRSSRTSGRTLETDPASSPAFGKRESYLPFYKNITLVVSILVTSLVVLLLLFAVVVCFKKHSRDRRDGDDYESSKAVGDSLKMSITSMSLPTKPPKLPHYSCPAGKIDYAEPYVCNDSAVSKQ